jgi:acyl-CoA dehydrogenase
MRLTVDSPFLLPRHREWASRASAIAPSLPAEGDDVLALGRDAVKKMAGAGLLGLVVPSRHSGALEQVEALGLCAVREELAAHSGLADSIFAVQGLGTQPIVLGGSDAQREEFLPLAARGERVFAFALTEPEAGSDAAALSTTARREGDHYVLDGSKRFISNAGLADHYTVFARTGEGTRGISAFLVDANAPGLTVGPQMPVIAPHPIAELHFHHCVVPASRKLGEEGQGLKLALGTLDLFRSTVGAAAVGMARRALKEALAYTQKRVQFGAPLGELQGVQFLLAESAVELDAARLLVHHAASVKDGGSRVTYEAAVGKLFATEAAQRIIDRSLQLHGGNGVLMGFAVERLYREIRALRIYEGASEVQKLVIARELQKSG